MAGLLLAACVNAPAAERMALSELLSSLKQHQAGIRDIQFDFEQTLTASPAGPQENSHGRAFIKIPGRFRIERSGEREQIFIRNGGKFWIYTPSYKQALVASWKGWAKTQQMPPGWIDLESYVDQLEKGFDLSLEDGGNQGPYVLMAKPKDGTDETLKLWIEPGGFLPVRIEYRSGPAVIDTTISNSVLNSGLDDGLFGLQAALDVEIITL